MDAYKKPYLTLFNQITDSIQILENECRKLKLIQREVEQLMIDNPDKFIIKKSERIRKLGEVTENLDNND